MNTGRSVRRVDVRTVRDRCRGVAADRRVRRVPRVRRETLSALGELGAHVLELLARRHLLREQRRLDAVEQTLEPADQLRLCDAQLDIGGRDVGPERQRQPVELVAQVRGQRGAELVDRALEDDPEALACRFVERRGAHLVEQLLDHRARRA